MKDYYKILGVKKNASEEEIRTRWIGLTKHYHPDLSKGHGSDQKIKEINEAYQTLKFSSTRMEYDLRRRYYGKRKGFGLNRTIFLASLLLFIIGSILFIRSKSLIHTSLNPVRQEIVSLNSNQINPTNPRSNGETAPPIPVTKPEKSIKVEEVVPKEIKKRAVQEGGPPPASLIAAERKLESYEKPSTSTMLKFETSTEVEKDVPLEISKIVPREVNKIDSQTHPIKQTEPIDQKDETVQTVQMTPLSPPPPQIAREEEVRQFFINYIERYTLKNIDGFLSLFSSKAAQNQKDGMEGIKKIYTNFFNQSQELRYHVDDMEINIYENCLEVKARYEVNQTLKKGREKRVWKGLIRWVLVKEDDALKILYLDFQPQKAS